MGPPARGDVPAEPRDLRHPGGRLPGAAGRAGHPARAGRRAPEAGAPALARRAHEVRAGGVAAASPAAPVPRRADLGARRDRPGRDPPVPHRIPRAARRDRAAHVALHAGRDRARGAGADDQPGPPAVHGSAGGARGRARAPQGDRVGAGGRGGRRQPGARRGAGRVRRGEELPFPERGARGATRGRARDQRPPPRRSPGGRSVDRGSADRGGDPARVRARCGGRRVIRRYAALIRNAWLVDLQYRASIVLWLLWGVAEPAIALGIWWTIAGDGSVAGYARADFARYFFAVMLINQLTIAWDSWYLDRWIREGDLNYRLARPLHPAHEAVAENIAYKARTASVILVVWLDRKSTRLNSSHDQISYAVFCLKKKKNDERCRRCCPHCPARGTKLRLVCAK